MQLVPVPTTKPYIDAWLPVLEKFKGLILNGREGELFWHETLDECRAGKIQMFFIVNNDKQPPEPVGSLGLQYLTVDGAPVAEGCWVVGRDTRLWLHLLPELERYLAEHVDVHKFGTKCRKGWARLCEPFGYKQTHVYIEKRF